MSNSIESQNDLVSDYLKVTPLKAGQSAIYKLLVSDIDDTSRIDDATGKPLKHTPKIHLTGVKYIVDNAIKSKPRIEIKNIVGYRNEVMPDKSLKPIPIVERVKFKANGLFTVTSEFQETYFFMERNPQNASNPYVDKTKKPVFYRIDSRKRLSELAEKNYLLSRALVHITDSDKAEIESIVGGLDPTTRSKISVESLGQMRSDLFEITKENPQLVMRHSSNTDLKRKIQLMDCEYFGLIEFLDDGHQRCWILRDGQKIIDVDATVNKIDALISYITDEKTSKIGGRELYVQLIELLKKVTSNVK